MKHVVELPVAYRVVGKTPRQRRSVEFQVTETVPVEIGDVSPDGEVVIRGERLPVISGRACFPLAAFHDAAERDVLGAVDALQSTETRHHTAFSIAQRSSRLGWSPVEGADHLTRTSRLTALICRGPEHGVPTNDVEAADRKTSKAILPPGGRLQDVFTAVDWTDRDVALSRAADLAGRTHLIDGRAYTSDWDVLVEDNYGGGISMFLKSTGSTRLWAFSDSRSQLYPSPPGNGVPLSVRQRLALIGDDPMGMGDTASALTDDTYDPLPYVLSRASFLFSDILRRDLTSGLPLSAAIALSDVVTMSKVASASGEVDRARIVGVFDVLREVDLRRLDPETAGMMARVAEGAATLGKLCDDVHALSVSDHVLELGEDREALFPDASAPSAPSP